MDDPALPPCPAPFSLARHVLAGAARDPDRIALAILRLTGSERWSHGRLERAVLGLAGAFAARGLPPGSRILLRLGNGVDFPLAFLGAIAADLVPVPTSPQLTAPEIARIAAELDPALIVAGDGIALPDPCPWPVLAAAGLQEMAEGPPLAPVEGDPDRPAYIVYTSGTSGQPRGVIHAHRAIWARRAMFGGWTGLEPGDRILHAGAFNWTYTLGTGLLDPWSIGATALIPAPGITPAQLPLLLKRHDATIFAAAPGIYRQMLRAPIPALPRLRHGLSAGETLPDALRAAWQAATGTPIHEAFGMSEVSTFVSGSPARPAPAGTLGHPQPGRRVAILGPGHAPVPPGDTGQIALAADDPGLMLGYLGAPGETAARHSPDGQWFLTGDMGRMEADGAVAWLGREDDMMNAGGLRVSPREVETAMEAHPAIAEAAAVEIGVGPGTTVIGLFYAGDPVPEDELAGFAAQRLARYKCPRLFRHCDALPRNANGKLMRRQIRQDHETSHDPA
ncbi:class I adenylate-forming enzyme family protein [Mangrovicoccus algicola]|nr:class I adenylate-forming enzyme family protein [Mangrovicoccus algicola]